MQKYENIFFAFFRQCYDDLGLGCNPRAQKKNINFPIANSILKYFQQVKKSEKITIERRNTKFLNAIGLIDVGLIVQAQ